MSYLYIPVLPNAQATTEDSEIRARIQQSGLLQQGGTATQKIAAENIDLLLSGNWQYGTTISKKLKTELQSLGESAYEGLPYYDPTTDIDHRGYYELRQVDVSPPQKDIESMYEYTAALTFTGTHETHWRAVETNVETIDTGLATGSGGLIGIPATASKVRWFDTADGTESATAASTVAGEFGNVELYDPTQPSFSNPTLIYEVPFGDESGTDVRVWDDLDAAKYYTLPDGTEVAQWVHAFHTAFEFDGDPVVDNGHQRIRYDEPNSVVELYEWDETIVTFANSTTDWSSDSNATLSTTSENSYDGIAIRGDTDDAGLSGNRNITYNPSGTFDFGNSDFLTFWYYTNKSDNNSIELIDGAGNSDRIFFSEQVSAFEGSFVEINLSDFDTAVDMNDINSITFYFTDNTGVNRFIIVDSIRHGDLAWNEIAISHSNFSLIDADFERIGPVDTRVYAEFEEDASGDLYHVVLSTQRGNDRPVARDPGEETWNSAFETYLGQFVSTQTTDPKGEQSLRTRQEVK